MKTAPLLALTVLLASGRSAAIEPAAPDKSGYHLFRPVPDDLLRDLDTDRPDKTNSPTTLDAGRFQIETGLVVYTRNDDDGVRTESWTAADTDLRIGLTNWAELQLELPLFQTTRDTDRESNETDRSSGIGDLSVVLKANFLGNDSDDTAAGMECFVKTPTASGDLGNGEVEGGATFLFSVQLPGDFGLAVNSGAVARADDDGGHHADIVNSVSVSRAIVGPLSGYVELFSSVPTRHSGDWVGTVDVGSMLQIGKHLLLDAGLNIGVTDAADDLEPFLGASYRF